MTSLILPSDPAAQSAAGWLLGAWVKHRVDGLVQLFEPVSKRGAKVLWVTGHSCLGRRKEGSAALKLCD